ncbi:hypothetical protein GCW_03415 [Mycoplasmoides gallisepticum S6]|uniref:Septation ring formation regulator n=1 Tax=Mycoplasmoides gallisepticum S6 TaxID=1006581 RepID=A0A0F6CL89_MYCGL|nr:hypothetical protein [Mycoplasmoides gallisepticum]AHB99861.1 hypothetical protein GCW_03415 [Mycoplasmoides gallisepticum S6]
MNPDTLKSLSTQSILIIVLAAIATVVVVLYAIYFVIFIKVRRSVNKNYKFREKYNVLSAKNYNLTIQRLAKLANDQTGLKHVVQYVNKFNNYYREQINSVYEPINELCNFDYHFDFKYVKQATKQINLYLDKIETLDRSFTQIKGDISGYKNHSSELIVSFKELFDNLIKFLEKYILPTFDNEELLRMVNSFSSCLFHLEESATKLLNNRLIAIIEHWLKNLPALIKMAKTYFVLNKLRVRLKYFIEDIYYSFGLLVQDPNFTEEKKQKINTIIKYTNKDLQTVHQLLMQRNFKQAQMLLADKFNLIEPLKTELELETKSKNTIAVIYQAFKYWIDHYLKNFEQLKDKLTIFIVNFEKDHILLEQIRKLSFKSDQLKLMINEINEENQKKLSHKDYLFLISNIANNATKLNESLEVLVKTILDNIAAYENFLFNTNNLKLQFVMIKNYYQANELKNDKLYKLISDNINQLVELEQNLNKNYKENINKFDQLHQKMEANFLEALKTSIKQVALKELCEHTFMFLHKYIYESVEIKNFVSDFRKRLFDNGLYEECLTNQIILLNKMKQAAKQNQIVLS